MLNQNKILLTGVTGYIGGRLLNQLEKQEYLINCLVRDPKRFYSHAQKNIQIFEGDVLNPDSLEAAMEGVDTAFYLVHSMGSDSDFSAEDRVGAQNFAQAASKMGVKRIIYLGGLGDSQENLSTHLKSRHEVGDVLRRFAKNVQVIEFRASIVIGSGSISFEMIRALCERLPIMITPKWVWTPAQPIDINDILNYLISAINIEVAGHQIFEIGGKDVVSYGGIMLEYNKQRELKRWLIPVPVLTPTLSSYWLGLVTPLYSRIGKKIIDSARFPTIVKDESALNVFKINPLGVEEAIKLALTNEDKEFADTHWSDAFSTSVLQNKSWAGIPFGNRIVDTKTVIVSVSPEIAFKMIQKIGGKNGWYFANWLWKFRGWVDRALGGVGLRRGRRSPTNLRIGDSVDFWRVEAFEPNKRLLLRAEMKLPGRAWLEFKVEPKYIGSEIRQTAIFDPIGISGLLYWYVLYPFHYFIFHGMIKGLEKAITKDLKNSH